MGTTKVALVANDWEPEGVLTVNVSALLVAPPTFTVTARPPDAADAAIAKFAVSDVALLTVTFVTTMPLPPTVRVSAPDEKPVPVNVIAAEVPRTPDEGAIAVSTRAGVGAGDGPGVGPGDGPGPSGG